MFFYDRRDDIIFVDFFFDNKKDEAFMLSAYTTFENNNNNKSKSLSLDFINKNLDLIQYKVNKRTTRVAFFKKKFFELFEDKEEKKDDYVEFDIPYIINITITYDHFNEFTKVQYKINGFKGDELRFECITKDGYFTEIQRLEGIEIIEKSRLDQKLKDLKENDEWIEKLRNGKRW